MKRILKTIEVAALGLTILIPVIYYFQLPEIIPIHFDSNGTPNKYGSRFFIFIVPVIAIVLYVSFKLCEKLITRKKQLFDFSEKYNEEQTELALQFTNYLSAVLLSQMAYLSFASIQVSLGNWETLGVYIMIVFLLPLTLIIGVFLIKYYKTL